MRSHGDVFWFPLALLVAVLCSGCYSESPLDPSPQVPVDARLLGSWNCVTADPESAQAATATFTAAPGVEREYHLTWQEAEKEPESYRAFISSVRGGRFLNIRPLEEDQYAGWAFFRYSFPRSGVIYVEMVLEEPFKAKEASASAKAARATLEKALRLMPASIQEFCVCIRHAPKEAEK